MKFTTNMAASLLLVEALQETDVVTLQLIIRSLVVTILGSKAGKASKIPAFKATAIDLKTKADRLKLLVGNKQKDDKAFLETVSVFAGLSEACFRLEDLITYMDTVSKIVIENKAKKASEKEVEDSTASPGSEPPQASPSGVRQPEGEASPTSTSKDPNQAKDQEPVNPAIETIETFLGRDAQKYRSFMKESLEGKNKLSRDAATTAFRKLISSTGTKQQDFISTQARQLLPLQILKLTQEDYDDLFKSLLVLAPRVKAYRTTLASGTVEELNKALGRSTIETKKA
jgi:hypothetical protein